jgi:hypothetical protein
MVGRRGAEAAADLTYQESCQPHPELVMGDKWLIFKGNPEFFCPDTFWRRCQLCQFGSSLALRGSAGTQ